MKIVLDANILIAALIKNGFTATLLTRKKLRLYAPAFLKKEMHKYVEEIARKTHRKQSTIPACYQSISNTIQWVDADSNFITHMKKASPDPKDVPYLALAQQLNCPLWSNDKRLKEQTVVQVVTTEELLKQC